DINENYYEVLLRLKGTDGHLIAPGAFLPAAERYNLMPAIDRWVIQRFFRYLSTANEGWISPATPLTNSLLPATSSLDASLPGASFYAINLSGASLNDDTFISFVREQFETYNISPRKICFEITETVAIANLSRATELITDLRQLGCQFALDDFGTGMSSLAYLKALPIDYLKIDGNFIRGITQDQFSQAVVRAVNNIGHLIGLKTVAEFVSTPAILETVKTLGIDFVQGHGIATPAPLPSRAE
ncbi:MAG: EAL domain-containing protein, partial [Cyanobacteria bacterium J06626_14]